MLEEFKKVFQFSILISILFILLGICLFLFPETIISMISYILGGIILVSGVISIIRYFTRKERITMFAFDLIYGVFSIIFGVIMITNPTALATVIPFVLGIWVIINSIVKMRYSFRLKDYNQSAWLSTFVISIVMLLWGFILLFNPFEGALVITQVIGLFIIVYAMLDLVEVSLLKKNFNNIVKKIS